MRFLKYRAITIGDTGLLSYAQCHQSYGIGLTNDI